MHFTIEFIALLYIYSIIIGGIAATAPLYSKSIKIAGGRLLNGIILIEISINTIKEL